MGGRDEAGREGSGAADARYRRVLALAVRAIEGAGIPYVVFGSLAAGHHGRPWPPGDIDFLVGRPDADRALKALESTGFRTEVDNPNWIYKAHRDGELVDLIFFVKGELHLDEELLEHSVRAEVAGTEVNLPSREDTLLIEALGYDAQVPQHWANAVAILGRGEIDWEYLERRARFGPRRMLSLLVYAQSIDLAVPDDVIRRLFVEVYGR